MPPAKKLRRAAVWLASLLASAPTLAAPTQAELADMLEKLNARVNTLEKRNAELEARLEGSPATRPTLEQRVKGLEMEQERVARGMDSEEISEREPEITARLKAIEYQALGMLKAARTVESLEGITAGISLTTVAQRPSSLSGSSPLVASDPSALTTSQLNYRGDVYVTIPLDNIGDTESRIFAQFRLGQGSGLNGLATYSKPSASAFRVLSSQPDDSVAILGQAWYQATIPLPFGGYKPRSREALQVNFGKMDPFVFFDQNTAANDETRQFLNTIFVHNPLLDAGGDIGVDANGFAPGFRVSYFNELQKPENWRLSVGVFGAGTNGASYQRSFSSPMLIAQAETQQKFFGGLTGNYRAYYWNNGQARSALDTTGTTVERHSGWGISADQRVDDAITLHGRYGHQMSGTVRFDRALTLGAEFGGQYWDRSGDSLGFAFGWLRTSHDYRDATAVDATLAGYGALGGERIAELYYRYRINKQFELSPDLQYIGRPGGNPDARALKVLGLRAQLTY